MRVQTRWGLGSLTVWTWNIFAEKLLLYEQTAIASHPLVMLLLVGLYHAHQKGLCRAFVFQDGGLGTGMLFPHPEGRR